MPNDYIFREAAIKNLRYLISGECCDTQMDYVEEIEMAIAALEKQEGKKPKETGLMGVHIPACASCNNPLMFITEKARSEFCPKCGQRIDWSDEL